MTNPSVYAEARVRVIKRLAEEYTPIVIRKEEFDGKDISLFVDNPALPGRRAAFICYQDGSLSRTLYDADDTVQFEAVEAREATVRAALEEIRAWLAPELELKET